MTTTDEDQSEVLQPIDRRALLTELRALVAASNAKDGPYFDTEQGHIDADTLLLRYINDPEIAAAYDALHKWYA